MSKTISIALLTLIFMTGCSGTMPKLGVNKGQLMPCPGTPNCVSSQATDEEHFIQPIVFIGEGQEAQMRLLQILKAWPRTNITVVEDDYVRVEFTSRIFRFIDDVEFYFSPTNGEEIIIHVRSASRVGRSDLGVNRKRIEQIRNSFKTRGSM